MDNQEIIMQLIVSSGSSRSLSMEAIGHAKNGDIDGAKNLLQSACDELGSAHRIQTELIQNEAAGKKTELSLLMIHAQDHLMNAITIRDLAREFVDLYENLKNR